MAGGGTLGLQGRPVHDPACDAPAGRAHHPFAKPAPQPSDDHCIGTRRNLAAGTHPLLPLAVGLGTVAGHQTLGRGMELPTGRVAPSGRIPAPGDGEPPWHEQRVPHFRSTPEQGAAGTGATHNLHRHASTSSKHSPRERDPQRPLQRPHLAHQSSNSGAQFSGPLSRDDLRYWCQCRWTLSAGGSSPPPRHNILLATTRTNPGPGEVLRRRTGTQHYYREAHQWKYHRHWGPDGRESRALPGAAPSRRPGPHSTIPLSGGSP